MSMREYPREVKPGILGAPGNLEENPDKIMGSLGHHAFAQPRFQKGQGIPWGCKKEMMTKHVPL